MRVLNFWLYVLWLILTVLLLLYVYLQNGTIQKREDQLFAYGQIQYSRFGHADPERLITDIESEACPTGESCLKTLPPPIYNCPQSKISRGDADETIITYPVYFNLDGSGRRPDLEEKVKDISKCERSSERDAMIKIIVRSYADWTGTRDRNIELIAQRKLTIVGLLNTDSELPVRAFPSKDNKCIVGCFCDGTRASNPPEDRTCRRADIEFIR